MIFGSGYVLNMTVFILKVFTKQNKILMPMYVLNMSILVI